MRNLINQEALQAGAAGLDNREEKYVDELCNIIRKGCTLNDFKNACT
jgi:hypothetical protein